MTTADARARAARALRAGLGTGHVWLLLPPRVNWRGLRARAHHESDAAAATELGRALVEAGLPDGPARFDVRPGPTGLRRLVHWRRLSGLVASLVVPAGLPMAGIAHAQTTGQSSDPRCFAQTGYRIDNDSFWDFFQQRGNARTFGYPVSRTFHARRVPGPDLPARGHATPAQCAVRSYYDALSAHPSGFSNPPDCTPATPQRSLSGGWNNDDSFFAFTRVSEHRKLMVQQNESNKKIWFTEFGYCANPTPPPGYEYCASLTEQDQANFLVQAFQMARSLDYVAGMLMWNLNFQLAVPRTNEEWGFGIIRSDWSGRPAYAALTEMSKS